MRAYAYEPSFVVGQSLTLCVEPRKQFAIALYTQEKTEALTPTFWVLTDIQNVTYLGVAPNGRTMFLSGSVTTPPTFNADWQWPSVTLTPRTDVNWRSTPYIAVAFEVNNDGTGADAIGRKIDQGASIYPYPPDSGSMALIIGTPYLPANANIAYVLPIATYHAYNWTGGGCFYDNKYKGTTGSDLVTMRRPGGGLAAELGEPTDYYDKQSPRQQFAHWDARFIRWMKTQNIACDYYTDLDLHTGMLDLSLYQLMISVGHHEYWSQQMRDALSTFLAGGGNYASFSGNTCFRPIDFGAWRTSQYNNVVHKIANNWPNYNESGLIGLSYGYGGGYWGVWSDSAKDWINTNRTNYGYAVRNASHWVFQGTGLQNGQTFGNGNNDYLVGYEADGLPPSSSFLVLGQSPTLAGWDVGKAASFGFLKDDPNRYKQHCVFNCGTTDWARVLTSTCASQSVVQQITLNALRALSDRPD